MKNIFVPKSSFLFFPFFLAIFNLGINLDVARAKPTNKAVKTRAKVFSLKAQENKSLDLDLTLSRGIANTSNTETLESSDQLEIAKTKLTIPSKDSSLIANIFSGKASWYGPGFHGRRTASGERYNQHALTAAHKNLSFGTKVKVTNLRNGRSVVVRINDRGPYAKGRIIDVSAAAARSLGMIRSGVAPVKITILGR